MRSFIQRFPTLVAAGIYGLLVALVFWPFWSGQLLMDIAISDQTKGYAFRKFAADFHHLTGHFPQWNPYIYGGMPFLQNVTNGDTFYWTAWLRLVMPVGSAMALGFMIHIALAGLFAYLLLRAFRLSWAAAFVGGLAYMWSGQIVSLVSPGHDGKMYVSAITPLALMFLYKAVTRDDWKHYVFFGASIGAALLSPQQQLVYYMLMAAGFFWLYLNFFSGEKPAGAPWWKSALLFAMALLIGVCVDAVQLLPWRENIPFTGRAAAGSSSSGWDFATSYSMPPEEIINVLWPRFSGNIETYWGRNPIKLHSEYLGVAVLMLATLGLGLKERRRLAWFFTFLAVYALLFGFGGHTPFYYIPYYVLPGIKLTRAPSMIFFLICLSAAVLAGFGVERLVRPGKAREAAVSPRPLYWWLGVLVVGVLLAFAGAFRTVMYALADPMRAGVIDQTYGTFAADTVRVLVLGALTAGIILLGRRRRWPGELLGLALGAVVFLDLWSIERLYIRWSPPERVTFAADQVVQTLQQDTTHFRVVELANPYLMNNYLMTHRVRQTLGYQGTELHRYDELMGGKGSWTNVVQFNPSVYRLITARYLLLSQAIQPLPAFLTPVGAGPLTAHDGSPVYVYRIETADPYAYLVPAAVRVPEEQILPTLTDPRSSFDPRRLLLLPPDAPAGQELSAVKSVPPAIATPVAVSEPHAGLLKMSLGAPAPAGSYLFVSENWYPAWHARVDGKDAPVLRAQFTLMGVPLPAGAREVELWVDDAAYRLGKIVSLLALAGVIVVVAYGLIAARRQPARA